MVSDALHLEHRNIRGKTIQCQSSSPHKGNQQKCVDKQYKQCICSVTRSSTSTVFYSLQLKLKSVQKTENCCVPRAFTGVYAWGRCVHPWPGNYKPCMYICHMSQWASIHCTGQQHQATLQPVPSNQPAKNKQIHDSKLTGPLGQPNKRQEDQRHESISWRVKPTCPLGLSMQSCPVGQGGDSLWSKAEATVNTKICW